MLPVKHMHARLMTTWSEAEHSGPVHRHGIAEASASYAIRRSHAARPQVSEDHCWLSLDGSGARGAAVEVTTDTAAKRGLAPSEDAWRGWLYSGGNAVVCSPQVPCASYYLSRVCG